MHNQEVGQFREEPGAESKAGNISLWFGAVFGVICPSLLFMIAMAERGDGGWLALLIIMLVQFILAGCITGFIFATRNLFERFSKKWAGQVGIFLNGGG